LVKVFKIKNAKGNCLGLLILIVVEIQLDWALSSLKAPPLGTMRMMLPSGLVAAVPPFVPHTVSEKTNEAS